MRTRQVLAIVGLALLLPTAAVLAQGVTSGALSGVVTDPDGEALPGATVTAIHEPTGTTYVAVTQTDGRFRVPSARVGGPYTVSVELSGFAPQVSRGINVSLGQSTALEITMAGEEFREELTVIGESAFISSSRTGAAGNVREELIQSLPTVDRGFNDFARTNPFFTVGAENEDPNTISVVGRNSRYNNIQIDGAVNNDLFGLADTGTPGGQTGAQPISLDAIQEVELVVSDYDVRQGGFSGGAVNVVTRSGTNDWKGSVYFFTRDNDYVGDGPEELGEFGEFSEDQYGFRLGGPITTDKAFFFVNGEISREDTPTGWSIDGSSGQAFGGGALVDDANRFRQILDGYGYDPGGLGELTRGRDSDKFFGRLDFNLAESHQLTLRHNYVDADFLINRPSSSLYEFPNEGYNFNNETNSTVAQLNSVLSPNAFSEARITYQVIKDRRHGAGEDFPHVQVDEVGPGGDFTFQAGTEQFSTQNELDQDILELTYDLTWIKGDHNFVFGTHNELFDFRNLFVQNAFGSYEFDTLDDLAAGTASAFEFTAIAPGQPDAQTFDVQQIGFYAGDEWRVNPTLTLSYGLRVDIPFFPDEPARNPFTEETYGLRTDSIPDGNELWQPRLGFNWDVAGDGRSQLRGGVGIFAGRAPYVWISNNYARTGIEQLFVELEEDEVGPIPFNPDPFNQNPDTTGADIGEFNLVDPDFEFPQELRYTLAYDRELPWWGLQGSIEAIFSDTLEGINYRNVNMVQTGTRTELDGRPIFSDVDGAVSGAYLITNTSEGESFNVAAKVEKPFTDGFWGFLSYAYGESEVVNEGTSSRAVSNWQFQEAIDPNNPTASTSDFEIEHRISAGVSYMFNRDTRYPTTVAAFYNRQSGRPYSYIFGFQQFPSINDDGFFSNDLLYVPVSQDEVIIRDGTWEDLNAYIEGNECLRGHRGEIAPRNCANAPWSDSLDVRVAQDIPLKWVNLQVSVDLENLMNLIDEDEGVLEYVNFNTTDPVDYGGIEDGKVVYELDQNAMDESFLIHNVESRWRAKLGLRVSF